MVDLGEFKTRSISGVSDELIERFDIVAKRLVGTRSALIKILMKSVVENERQEYMRRAKTNDFIRLSVTDTLKMCGLSVPKPEDPNQKEKWTVIKENE